eukprot:TRINITY_DN68142_c9_g1_i1.p1 TRINITY_DN68142_c9_g1~~TRINITY_DN68142_c9_g1_i1.p1  ORF type:complete len:261 (+),score=13.50 TRINITY_DN68142_c9_g1_i1:98-880(+)
MGCSEGKEYVPVYRYPSQVAGRPQYQYQPGAPATTVQPTHGAAAPRPTASPLARPSAGVPTTIPAGGPPTVVCDSRVPHVRGKFNLVFRGVYFQQLQAIDLKERILELTGIPLEDQVIKAKGRVLGDEQTLVSVGLANGCMVTLDTLASAVTPPPAAPPPVRPPVPRTRTALPPEPALPPDAPPDLVPDGPLPPAGPPTPLNRRIREPYGDEPYSETGSTVPVESFHQDSMLYFDEPWEPYDDYPPPHGPFGPPAEPYGW